MSNALECLKLVTKVVADTADFDSMKEYEPYDATTNPSLIFQVFKMSEFSHHIDDAIQYAKGQSSIMEKQLECAMDKLCVNIAVEILKRIPGRVSVEIDAKHSFNTQKSIEKAKYLANLFAEQGYGKQRFYIKLASTWQGIQAARELEKEGIACNLTLLFSFAQAVACAQAGVSLISPFVGRILDWNKKNFQRDYTAEEDPGVLSVTRIYNYYKKHGYKTIVMGASFRNVGEILHLTGCDNLTISPTLLSELKKIDGPIQTRLSVEKASEACVDSTKWDELTEDSFLFLHNEDAMAVEKLAEGIRFFNRDARALEKIILDKLNF